MPTYLVELQKRGLSLRRFAKLVNLSPEWVSQIFKGKEEPSAEAERRIREALEKCPWCGNKWPHPIPMEGEPSERDASTARRPE